jgi:hypothetical protein
MDMRFHWLSDQEARGQFKMYWQPGRTNLVDNFTKHHPPAHHVNVRAEFLTRVKDLAEASHMKIERQTKISSNKNAKLQGCVSLARLQDLDLRNCKHKLNPSCYIIVLIDVIGLFV